MIWQIKHSFEKFKYWIELIICLTSLAVSKINEPLSNIKWFNLNKGEGH